MSKASEQACLFELFIQITRNGGLELGSNALGGH